MSRSTVFPASTATVFSSGLAAAEEAPGGAAAVAGGGAEFCCEGIAPARGHTKRHPIQSAKKMATHLGRTPPSGAARCDINQSSLPTSAELLLKPPYRMTA